NNFDENVFIKVIVSNCILNNYKGFTNHFWQLYPKTATLLLTDRAIGGPYALAWDDLSISRQ
ncbi:MAG: hypothetical protein IJN30_00525, partial [Bacteroidales bacterium]|nr:hypothetical protein [Bacteroidales bacterium]